MDSKEFRIRGKEMIDFEADYLDTIEQRPVLTRLFERSNPRPSTTRSREMGRFNQ